MVSNNAKANITTLSEIFPFWMLKHFSFYWKEPPNPQNLFQLSESLLLDKYKKQLKKLWKLEEKKNHPNLFLCIRTLL